ARSGCGARRWIMRRFWRGFCGSIGTSGGIFMRSGNRNRSVSEGTCAFISAYHPRLRYGFCFQREMTVRVAEGVGDADIPGGVFILGEDDFDLRVRRDAADELGVLHAGEVGGKIGEGE